MQTKTSYFTKAEKVLWLGSLLFILLSFFVFDRANYLALITSLIGATLPLFSALHTAPSQCDHHHTGRYQ